ncbi:MAG: 50S ribosomal protein L11 methyltransferase [Oscillospiraceae bacterium]|nr:50S ribosomal protein L11 methyltransferase [Oscillospiraceae bacterium]
MEFIKLTLHAEKGGSELLAARLSELGIDGFEINGDSDLRELIKNTAPDLKDASFADALNAPESVTVYLPDDSQGRRMLSGALAVAEQSGLYREYGRVAEEDWENNWKQYFKPLKIGALIIKPSWEDADNPGNLPVLEIDPGSAFGTGQHATTKMCVELLSETPAPKGARVLDIGCGSGILSAAASLLGAKSVTAVDISRNAARVTEETLKKNGAGDYSVYCGDITSDDTLREKIGGNYDVITANITADVIIAMSGLFGGFLADGGRLIISGIIAPRLRETRESLKANGFAVVRTRRDDDWFALVLMKRSLLRHGRNRKDHIRRR